ncbi:MAG: TIGR03905 family TSCPD domain-containing protein [Ruminococcus sp.]|nr:TIGR03905 family TSCPD domain-containing protein [Ruminococcus sp.]
MTYEFTPQGVCSKKIILEVENGIVGDVTFIGGCNGNLKGIAALVKGMEAEDVIEKLSGIRCGFKNTSCPAQLAKALEETL